MTKTTNTTTTTNSNKTNNTNKAATISSSYQQKKAQAKQAGVNCAPRTFLMQPSLNIENLPPRLQGARCLPTQYVPPIPMCSQPFCPSPCCPPMMNPCCQPAACQPMYPSCPMPQPYCPPPAFQCYPPPPCYPCPPPPCPMPYPPCPPCIQMPPPPPPPCNPCDPCDPCNPCPPCNPCCKPQPKCCIAGKIICVPKGQRPMMQGQAKNSCIPGFSGESTGGKEQPASFNNCNFYVSELPKGFKKTGGGNNGGRNDNCDEDDDLEDGNTSNMRNPAAGDEKIIPPPYGYPGTTRKLWGYVDQEGVHLDNDDSPNNFNQARNMDSNRMGMGPNQRRFNDDNCMPPKGKSYNRNQQNYYDDQNEMSNRNFPSNRNQVAFSTSQQQMGGAKPSGRSKIDGPSNRNMNPSYSNRPGPSGNLSNRPGPSNHYSNHPDPSNHYSNHPDPSTHYSNHPDPSNQYSNHPDPSNQYSNRLPSSAHYSNRPPTADYSNRPDSYGNQTQTRGNMSKGNNYDNASKMKSGNGNYDANRMNTARANMGKVSALRRDEEQQANYCIPQDYKKPKVCQPVVWKRKKPCCMPLKAAKLKTLCQRCHNRFAQNMANCGLPMPGAPFDSSNNRKTTNKGMKTSRPMARNNEYTVNTAVYTETDQKPCSDSPCSSGSDVTVKKKSTVQIEMVSRSQAMTARVQVSQGVTPRQSTMPPPTECESSRPPMTECESSRPPMTLCESSKAPTTIVSIIASLSSQLVGTSYCPSQRAITNEPPLSSIVEMYAGPSFAKSSVTVAVPRGYRYIQAQVSQSAPHMYRNTENQIRNGGMSTACFNQKTKSETALQCNIAMPGIEAAIAAYVPQQRHHEHQNVRNTISVAVRPPPPPPNKCLKDKSRIQRIIIEKNPFDHTQHITVIKDQDMKQQRQNQCPPLNGRMQQNVYPGNPFNCDFNIYNVEQQLSATAIAALDQLLPGYQRNPIVQDMYNFQNMRVTGNCNPSELQELDQIFKAIEIATQRNGGNQCRDSRNRNNSRRNSDCPNTTKHITVVMPENNYCNNPCNNFQYQQAGPSQSYQPQPTTRQNQSIKMAPQRDYNIYDGQIQISNLSRSKNPNQGMTNQNVTLTGPEDKSFVVRPQESFTIKTTGSREPFFSVSSSHLPKNLTPYGESKNETNANIAPLNEINSRKGRAPKSEVMGSQTYNNTSYNQKNTSSFNQKQNSSFNQKQNSSFNQKQNSSFNQKQNSSFNQNPAGSNAPSKLVPAQKSITQTNIRVTDRGTEIEVIQTDVDEGMETDVDEGMETDLEEDDLEESEDEEEEEDYVPPHPRPPPPATNTYRPQTNMNNKNETNKNNKNETNKNNKNNGVGRKDLNSRNKNDDDENKRAGCGARNKYRCAPLKNCLSPRMVVCKGQKPIFSLFPPACPIRETNASIMRKNPLAHCETHNQDATPFPDYCLVRDAHHDDQYRQKIKFVDHCKGGNDGTRVQNEIPAEYRQKDPVVKKGVKRRLHQ